MSEINFPVLFGKWHTTVAVWNRWGLRAIILSNYTELNAWQKTWV